MIDQDPPFTRVAMLTLPRKAEAKAQFACADRAARALLQEMLTPTGRVTDEANPNGAARNIAGVFNERRSVLGLMPHPERLADPALGGTDGKTMLDGLVRELA